MKELDERQTGTLFHGGKNVDMTRLTGGSYFQHGSTGKVLLTLSIQEVQ